MLTITDIDSIDLAGLPAIHTAPVPDAVIGVVTAATHDPDLDAWHIELLDAGGVPVLGVDQDGAAIAAAGAAAWRPGQIAAVTVEDLAGRAWSVAVLGATLDDVLTLPSAADADWPRIIVDVKLLTA